MMNKLTAVRRVSFIGLDKMGRPMACNLLKKGFPLTVYDRDEKPVQELVRHGAQAAHSPKEVAERSEVVWIMVPQQAVEEVILGDQGVLQGMKEGGIVIDGGNSNPASSRRLSRLRRAPPPYMWAAAAGPPELSRGRSRSWSGEIRRLLSAVARSLKS